MTKIISNEFCKCSEVVSPDNILLMINQMKQELDNRISYHGNICNDEVVRISRSLDMLIVDYEEGRIC